MAAMRFRTPAALAALALCAALAGGCGASGSKHHPQADAPSSSVPIPTVSGTFDTKPGPAGTVLTQRADNTRLGWYSDQKKLTDASVASPAFGKRIAYPVDGKVYAQPLYVPGLTIRGAVHDVVIVATQHDTVYAFDADATGAAPPPLWSTSLLQPGARPFLAAKDRVANNRLCDSIVPEVGISSTPVIDWAAKRIYAIALDAENGKLVYRVHSLDLLTGQETQGSTIISASVPGTAQDARNGQVAFTATEEQQRTALLLVNGIIYAGFSSWCDDAPTHGWVLGYRAAGLGRAVVYNDTPDEYEGGVWQSEVGLESDTAGHIYVVTGNADYDIEQGGHDVGDTLLEMLPSAGTLVPVDSFTPFDESCLLAHDQDLGSGAPIFVPGHDEAILSSKPGSIYVLDAKNLGRFTRITNPCKQRTRTDVDKIKQELPLDTVTGGMWGTFGYWRGGGAEYIYAAGATGPLTQWRLGPDGRIDPASAVHSPLVFSYPGAIPVVSSDGSVAGTGIVWTVDTTQGAVLRAYDAADVAHELWDSSRDKARDGLDDTGDFNHFTVPAIAGDKVFVGDQHHLQIYGLPR